MFSYTPLLFQCKVLFRLSITDNMLKIEKAAVSPFSALIWANKVKPSLTA